MPWDVWAVLVRAAFDAIIGKRKTRANMPAYLDKN
jgi:hypothetical protein